MAATVSPAALEACTAAVSVPVYRARLTPCRRSPRRRGWGWPAAQEWWSGWAASATGSTCKQAHCNCVNLAARKLAAGCMEQAVAVSSSLSRRPCLSRQPVRIVGRKECDGQGGVGEQFDDVWASSLRNGLDASTCCVGREAPCTQTGGRSGTVLASGNGLGAGPARQPHSGCATYPITHVRLPWGPYHEMQAGSARKAAGSRRHARAALSRRSFAWWWSGRRSPHIHIDSCHSSVWPWFAAGAGPGRLQGVTGGGVEFCSRAAALSAPPPAAAASAKREGIHRAIRSITCRLN